MIRQVTRAVIQNPLVVTGILVLAIVGSVVLIRSLRVSVCPFCGGDTFWTGSATDECFECGQRFSRHDAELRLEDGVRAASKGKTPVKTSQ